MFPCSWNRETDRRAEDGQGQQRLLPGALRLVIRLGHPRLETDRSRVADGNLSSDVKLSGHLSSLQNEQVCQLARNGAWPSP